MIRAVLFDLDDTLFDHSHCARSALAGVRDVYTCFASFSDADLERASEASDNLVTWPFGRAPC